jgi:hypothetical protein
MRTRKVVGRFALRHRGKLISTIRYCGWLLLIGLLVLGCTVGPTFYFGWRTMVPAAIGAAICAVLLFSMVVLLPLEFIAYVAVKFDQTIEGLPFPGIGSGRGLYRESGRLDAMAREAGLPLLSDFESPDVLYTGGAPIWYLPASALPTVEHLLAGVDRRDALRRDLEHLQSALSMADAKGAKFYLLLLTWSGFTNAEIEARRRGEIIQP